MSDSESPAAKGEGVEATWGHPGGQLLFYLQPRASAVTGELVGFEALIRWQHPELGLGRLNLPSTFSFSSGHSPKGIGI